MATHPFTVKTFHNLHCSFLQYYDWENNLCHPLSYILNDGISIEEKDVVIPAELDPSQNTIFPDFEPFQIKKLVCFKLIITVRNKGR